MKYARQAEAALSKLDMALAKLRTMVKRGQNRDAIHFMEEGELKEKFEELQNIIEISQVNNIGARGTSQTGAL